MKFTIRRAMIGVAISAALLAAFEAGRRFEASTLMIAPRPLASVAISHRFDTFCPLPQLEGMVVQVDQKNGRLDLSIGSDDGLARGTELYVYRAGNPPRCLGQIRVVSLDVDRSIGESFGGTEASRASIREGDRIYLYPLK